MAKVKWTEELIREEASKYESRAAFCVGSNGAYSRARKLGLLDELGVGARKEWNLEKLKQEVVKYQTKTEFRSQCSAGACYAQRHGLMETLFPSAYVRSNWDDTSVRLEASKYPSKKAFKAYCSPAYGWALRHKIIDELFENQLVTWTEELVRLEAKKYNTKFEFQKGTQPAYRWAKKNGILNDLGFKPGASTFLFERPSLLYIVDTVLTDGVEGIMFGITNRENPIDRYRKVDLSQMTNRYAYKFPTGADAYAVESRLKREFKDHHITAGLSPFKGSVGVKGGMGCKEKKGTTGEILYATAGRVNLDVIVRASACGEPFVW